MSYKENKIASCNKSDQSEVDNNTAADGGGVPQKDSRDTILEFLHQHDYPHRTKEIYAGLIYGRDVNFGYRAVQEAVRDLLQDGKIRKVEVDSDDGVVRDLPADTSKRGYYVITDRGRAHVEDLP